MGVDSGLPDFRGSEGFWRAYPPFRALGLSFYELADPRWFAENPRQAWGFYGHRMNLYRATVPHGGFQILKRWSDEKQYGSFVFTSNVDCHFQAAGYDPDRIVECHGSFRAMQCSKPCCDTLWSSESVQVSVDDTTMLADEPLPKCKFCGTTARPNILMFNDGKWIETNTEIQELRLRSWIASVPRGETVVVEMGAGTAVPSVRRFSERLVQQRHAKLIRINPRESKGTLVDVSIAAGALETLRAIDTELSANDLL